MELVVEEKVVGRSFFSRHKLAVGSAFYALAAIADIGMTVTGMGGDINLEGNPVMRAVMAEFGPEAGLLLGKALVGAICFVIAKYGEREIRRGAAWIQKLPSTKRTRAWMRTGDRSWIAYAPLYIVAASQLLAAASWVFLKLMV
jgi:hypothetical protein